MELIKDLQQLTNVIDPIDDIDAKMPDLLEAAAKMTEFLQAEGSNALGLAAPQIGIELPLICVKRDQLNFYVNPHYGMKYRSKTNIYTEGCYSLPNVVCKVARAEEIDVSGYKLYMDGTYKTLTGSVSKEKAVVFQHEVDHLHGILILHRAIRIMPSDNTDYKSIYYIKDMTDFCVEGSNQTMIYKKSIDLNPTNHYIIGLLYMPKATIDPQTESTLPKFLQ